MAVYRVYSGAGSSGTPWDTWDKAEVSINTLITAVAAGPGWVNGDVILVASDHVSGTTADRDLTFPCSLDIVSVDRTTFVTTYGADLFASTGHCNYHAPAGGVVNMRGFRLGTQGNTNQFLIGLSAAELNFVECVFDQDGGTSKYVGNANYSGTKANFIGCTFLHDSAASSISCNYGDFHFINCTWSQAVTNLVTCSNKPNYLNRVTIENSDCSGAGNVLALDSSNKTQIDMILRNCRMKSGFTKTTGAGDLVGSLLLENCLSTSLSATPLGMSATVGKGYTDFKVDTSFYVAASDGENLWSYYLETSSVANLAVAQRSPCRLVMKHPATGDKTLTIRLLSDQADLTDAEVSAIVQFGDEANPAYCNGETVNTHPGAGAAAVADTSPYLKSDTSTWVGMTTETRYKLVIPGLNPTEPGWVITDIYLAHPSAKLWIDPDQSLA